MEMYSNLKQGEQETTDQLGSMHQNFSQEVQLHISRRQDTMPTGATLSCNQTLQS